MKKLFGLMLAASFGIVGFSYAMEAPSMDVRPIDEFREQRDELKMQTKEMRMDRKDFYSTLDEELRASIKAIREAYDADREALHAEYADMDRNAENLDMLYKALKELRAEASAEIRELIPLERIGEYDLLVQDSVAHLDERYQLRKDFRNYKRERYDDKTNALMDRVQAKLDKIEDRAGPRIVDAYERVITKIEDRMASTEDEARLEIFSALLDIIRDRLASFDNEGFGDEIEGLFDDMDDDMEDNMNDGEDDMDDME